MHLMYTLSPEGKRIYTLKKAVDGVVSLSAHPARFSPDDKMSRQRVTLKKRCVRQSPLGHTDCARAAPLPLAPLTPLHSLTPCSFDLIPVKASTFSK